MQDAATLLSNYHLSEQNLEIIRTVGRHVIPKLGPFVEDFYAWLEQQPEFSQFFRDPVLLTRVKGLQEDYWTDFFEARVDDNYIQRRVDIGKVHARIRLPLEIYLIAMDFSYAWVVDSFRKTGSAGAELFEAMRSVGKLLHLDTSLVVGTFHERYIATIADRTRELADSNTTLRSEIRERRRAEEELQRRRDELAHVSRVVTMGELATSIAHELNQPLTGILSGAGVSRRLLAADEPDLEKLDEVQQLIVDSATRAGKIIRHQFNFLRRGEVKETPVAINELIRNIEPVIRAEVLRNKIELLLDLAPDLPSIMGDPIQLEQVILNLIRNSLETMEDPAWGNREVLVQTSMSGPHEIMLRVRDTGPPIDDETFAQMFTPFHSTKPEGLGMGLLISRTIVEAHGGRLGATRNADLGITIDLTLACEDGSSR